MALWLAPENKDNCQDPIDATPCPEILNTAHALPRKCFGKPSRWERLTRRIAHGLPHCLKQPVLFLGESDNNRKRRACQVAAPRAIVLIMISLIGTLLTFLRTIRTSNTQGFPGYDCQPPGYMSGGTWYFFSIDLWVAKMSFGQAKIVDILWNWVVGRGLQFLLALLSYKTFTSSLMRIVESDPVTYDLFVNLTFYATKVDSVWALLKSLFGQHRKPVKLILSWLLLSTVYLAFIPCVFDIMSGYETDITTTLILPDKTPIKADASLDTNVLYSIIPIAFTCWSSPVLSEVESSIPLQNSTGVPCIPIDGIPALLESPSLACQTDFCDSDLRAAWQQYMSKTPKFWTEDPNKYSCVAEKDVYRWGFSGEWLLLALAFHTLWCIGTAVVWRDTQIYSQCYQKWRWMGPYRALIDLGAAVNMDLGPDLGAYSEEELAAALKKRPRIKYGVQRENGQSRIVLSSRPSTKVRLEWDKEYG